MWQWFLRLTQIAVFGTIAVFDYVADFSEGRKAYGLVLAGIITFGVTQALVGMRWLLVDRKRRA
jgi:hypothetical protein